MQTAEEKREKVTSAGDVKAMGGARGPGKGRGPCTYRGFPLCLRRFFSLTGFSFFLPVRLLRFAWHRLWISKYPVNYDIGYIQYLLSPAYPSVDDIRCVVVESDGEESVCEATLRDDVPHCEET